MANLRTISVNDAAASQVTTASFCTRVVVGEDASVVGFPTSDLLVSKNGPDGPFRRLLAGSEYPIPRKWNSFGIGDIVCWIKTVAGSTTLFIDEAD